METFNLKEVFEDDYASTCGWNYGFKFEVKWSKQGVARIYIGDRKTKYFAGGRGYCKESTVIASMINDLIGKQKYNKDVYGSQFGFLAGGVGFRSISESFKSIDFGTAKMEQYPELSRIYYGIDSNVYEVFFPVKTKHLCSQF